MTTPANLRAIRLRLGMSFEEAARFLCYTPGNYGPRERAKSVNVYRTDLEALQKLEQAFEEHIYQLESRHPPPRVLVGYPSDEAFQRFEPDAASLLHFNSVHRMALAQAQVSTGAPIVEIVPDQYALWLAHHGRSDSLQSREAWALEKLPTFRLVPP